MIVRSRKVLDRLDALDGRIGEVVDAVADRDHHDEILAANVARVDERVVAAHQEAAEKVRHTDLAAAAVRAEMAAVKGNWRGQIQMATAEREALRADLARVIVERDEAIGRAEHAEAEQRRLVEAWRARGEQLGAAEAEASRWEQRASALEVTVEGLTALVVRLVRLAERAVPKVPAKTTRGRYLAELAAITAAPEVEIELADSA